MTATLKWVDLNAMRGVYGFLVAAFFASPTIIAAESLWQGVWRGTIGDQRIMVCLDSGASGSYYYLHRLWGIPLDGLQDRVGTLTEGRRDNPSGSWKLEHPSGDGAAGQWSDASGKRSLPIRLTRVHTKVESCSSDGRYNAARIEAHKLVEGNVERFQGKAFRRLLAVRGKLSTIQFVSDEPNVLGVNEALRARLHTKIGEYFECPEQPDLGVAYAAHARPIFWSSHIVTIRDTFVCPPDRSDAYSFTTWDLKGARAIELISWFNDRAFTKKIGYYEPTSALRRLLFARWKTSGRMCEDVANSESTDSMLYKPVHPTARGVLFTPALAAANRACEDPFVVPYAQLGPFLSESGKAAVESIVRGPRK